MDIGSFKSIFAGEPDVARPVVQCLLVKPIASQNGNSGDRYRIVLNDGVNFVQSMITTSLNSYIHDGKLRKGILLKVNAWQANTVSGKK